MKGTNDQRKAVADATAGGNLDQVREILFGSQARESEKRFARLEERFSRETAELREEMKNRFDSLESFVKSEVKSLIGRIRSEQSERATALKDLAKDLAGLTRSTEKRLAELDERTAKEEQKLRNQILEQSKALRDEMHRNQREQSATFEQTCEELRGDKMDRVGLANLFTEMAVRLNNDLEVPKKSAK